MFVLFFFLFLNLAISYFNASQVGRYWSEKSQLPAGIRFMMWCGAIMSVCGFFIVYVSIITMVMKDLHLFEAIAAYFEVEITPAEVELLVENIFNLAYLVVIFPVLGSGLAIWANSIAIAFVRRDAASIGIAGYNTWAMARNTINAVRYVPQAGGDLVKGLGSLFKSKSSRQLAVYLTLFFLPIVLSLGGAIASTALIIKASDEKYQLEEQTR